MNNSESKNSYFELHANHHTGLLALWIGTWMLSFTLVTFGPEFLWSSNKTLTVVAVIGNMAIGIGVIWAAIKHLRSLDAETANLAMFISLSYIVALIVGYRRYR